MGEERKCWVCKRTFEEALKEFNDTVQSDDELPDAIKHLYVGGKKVFFPDDSERYVDFRLATVRNKKYGVSGGAVGQVHIWLCPVCSGLFQSILERVGDKVSKEDLKNVSILMTGD